MGKAAELEKAKQSWMLVRVKTEVKRVVAYLFSNESSHNGLS